MAAEKYKVGDRFGNWTLIEKLPRTKAGTRWRVMCDCTLVKEVHAANVYTGKSKMCPSCASKAREERFRKNRQYGRG